MALFYCHRLGHCYGHPYFLLPADPRFRRVYDADLKNGEYLIVSKWSHVMGEVPNYGDIVIIDSRVQYPRTWKDDVAEPMNNYLAFF